MIWMKAYPKHVDIGFWRGTEMDDPKKVLTGDGEKMRHIKITSVDDIPADALVELVQAGGEAEHREGQPDARPMKQPRPDPDPRPDGAQPHRAAAR